LVDKTLKGKPFENVMQHNTRDNIIINALETNQPKGFEDQPIRPFGDWAIASPNWSDDPEAVNRDILDDLERGATAIALTVGTDSNAGIAPTEIAVTLCGVYLDMVPLTLIQGEDFRSGVQAYETLIQERGYNKGSLSGSLGVDPIGTLARTGRLQTSVDVAVADGAEIASRWTVFQPNVATFNADGTVYSNAGASEATEVAAAISSAIDYLRAMEKAGLSLQSAAKQIQFTFTAGANIWLTMAKLRAARRLWASVLSACDINDIPMHINAVSAVHAVTMKDPWTNVLRGTAACFAAALGGADVVTTLPHDLFFGASDSFSRRIARNIQIVLMEESNLARVSDPAAGSFALEKLTSELAEKSTSLLASLESSGGIVANLRSGALAEKVADTATQQAGNIRRRKIGIIGVSEFPNIHEKSIEKLDAAIVIEPTTLSPAVEKVTPLPLRRMAQVFETLRFKSDDLFSQNGMRPKIAVLNLGVAAGFTARAAYSKNFFEAGGIEAATSTGSTSVEDAVAAYRGSGAKIAVMCGADQQYIEMGVTIARTVKQAGCIRLYVAGKPENIEDLEAAGVDEIIYMGCDVVASLKRAYEALGYPNDRDES